MAAAQFAMLFDQGPSNEWRGHLILDPAVRPSGGTRSQKIRYFRNAVDMGAPSAISAATNATPIVLTVASGHGISADDYVLVEGVLGNTAANGMFRCSASGATSVTLEDSVGNASYTSGGTIREVTGLNLNLLEVVNLVTEALANERAAGN
ncbi:MAG: hypothetical protein E6Q97_31870 [Desulfurellales bacterium]|nr:MAG: hypothetical protein E6Q97_31870 [Desulfurellales bacterium]